MLCMRPNMRPLRRDLNPDGTRGGGTDDVVSCGHTDMHWHSSEERRGARHYSSSALTIYTAPPPQVCNNCYKFQQRYKKDPTQAWCKKMIERAASRARSAAGRKVTASLGAIRMASLGKKDRDAFLRVVRDNFTGKGAAARPVPADGGRILWIGSKPIVARDDARKSGWKREMGLHLDSIVWPKMTLSRHYSETVLWQSFGPNSLIEHVPTKDVIVCMLKGMASKVDRCSCYEGRRGRRKCTCGGEWGCDWILPTA